MSVPLCSVSHILYVKLKVSVLGVVMLNVVMSSVAAPKAVPSLTVRNLDLNGLYILKGTVFRDISTAINLTSLT
jgi:hypothetical protein